MKLFWKLFCAMVTVTVLGCSVCAFLLVETEFRSALEREVTALGQENDLLRYAVSLRLESAAFPGREQLADLTRGMELSAAGGAVVFRISDEAGRELARTGTLPVEAAELLERLGPETRGWELRETEQGRWLHGACPMETPEGIVFLENGRPVEELFRLRESRYRTFHRMIPALAGAAALAAALVSALMVRPLGHLADATRRMAEGELGQRVPVDGDDEIAWLSRDFNTMAERLEEQMNRLRSEARRQEDFVASFTHELKTPMTSIIGYAELLRARPEDRERVQEWAGYIFREGRRLEALSRKLLELIVLEKRDLALRRVAMEEFLARVAGAMAPELEKAGLTLRLETRPGEALLDPDLMEAVCLNLLDNARKASFPGGEVRLSGAPEGRDYRVEVEDHGRGIPPEELERVMEPFYMVEKSRSRSQGGSGLGLALCQRVVELHGGKLELESVPGQGTLARFRLKGGEPA